MRLAPALSTAMQLRLEKSHTLPGGAVELEYVFA
jgi:hypothetical protein